MMQKLLLALFLTSFNVVAVAQDYPHKPIKLVVGFAPAGAADYVARSMSDALGKALGQSIIVENKAGANGATAVLSAS